MKRTPTPEKSSPEINFELLGKPRTVPTMVLLDLLKYATIEAAGKNRWRVTARNHERVHGQPHVVRMSGVWTCTCRQFLGGRACEHLVAARQFVRFVTKPVPTTFISFDFNHVGASETSAHLSLEKVGMGRG